MLNPDDYVITRKRKKYRFAHFTNAANCFELVEWKPKKAKHLVVEVGAGTGLFLVELAKLHPEATFIAIDVKGDRLQKGGRAALAAGLSNIFFVRARADQLTEVVKPGSVNELWLTFSDPFPRKRDAKRRLSAPQFLEIYKYALKVKNAYIRMKTDDSSLFQWSLEQFVATGWGIEELSFDLHASSLRDEYKIMTSYEQKWTSQGLSICYATVSRAPIRR